LNEAVKINFLDMDFAAVDRFDHMRVHVDAQNLASGPRNYRRCWQADIAKAQYANVRFFVD
jgi:hypothetical protein